MSKRTDFVDKMIKGNKFLSLMNKYKEQIKSEDQTDVESDFIQTLNKLGNQFNCLKLWGIEVLKVNEKELEKSKDLSAKEKTAIFNKNAVPVRRNETGTLLSSEANVRSLLDFRKNLMQEQAKTR